MFNSLQSWLDQKLNVDAYELRGQEIVSKGLPRHRIPIGDIQTWQETYIGGCSWFIAIHFANGRTMDCEDKYEQLLHILQAVAPDKQLPFIHY